MAKKSQRSQEDSKKLNPSIRKVLVGIKETREIKVYPLSINDQFDFANHISVAFNELQNNYDVNNLDENAAIDFLQNFIGKNIDELMDYVVDPEEKPTFDELTNNQLSEIATAVFEENFEGLIKNFRDLFKRAKGLFQTQES